MAYRRMSTMDIRELIRLLRTGERARRIAEVLGHNRRTVMRYRQGAAEQGLWEGALPSPAELRRQLSEPLPVPLPPQQTSSVAPYADEIRAMRERGMRWRRFGGASRNAMVTPSATAPCGASSDGSNRAPRSRWSVSKARRGVRRRSTSALPGGSLTRRPERPARPGSS